ncbi:MAG: hypothetical protein EOM62_17110 [Bacteroidia bacterium]|nr:hypothetical protein [Bacteroidia bacterium]
MHKKYEFGSKASIVTTQKGNWILCTTTYKGSPNDITTLSDSLVQVQQMTGCYPEEVYCDKGYRGKKVHEGLPCKVFIPGTQQMRHSDSLLKRHVRLTATDLNHRLGLELRFVKNPCPETAD